MLLPTSAVIDAAEFLLAIKIDFIVLLNMMITDPIRQVLKKG
jgi:hypothetical protein